jgi:hypothetical protein
MSQFERLKPAVTLKRVAKNGIASSDDMNDFREQVVHDVALVFRTLNGSVLPILDGLGYPGTYPGIDVVAQGLAGTTMPTDPGADKADPYLWNAAQARPAMVSETLGVLTTDAKTLYDKINDINARLGTTGSETGEAASTATLAELDTKVNYQTSLLTALQIRTADMATNAGVLAAVSGVVLASGNVSADAGIAPTAISGIDLTTVAAYGALPATYDLRDSVLRAKRWIEDLAGVPFASYGAANVPTVPGLASGYATLSGHVNASGTGARTVRNPHALDVADLSDAAGTLSQLKLLASFDVHPSGNAAYEGGYAYVPESVRAATVAVTYAVSGAGGLQVDLMRLAPNGISTAVKAAVKATSTAGNPGSGTGDAAGFQLAAGDMLYVANVTGSSLNGRVLVFGRK